MTSVLGFAGIVPTTRETSPLSLDPLPSSLFRGNGRAAEGAKTCKSITI